MNPVKIAYIVLRYPTLSQVFIQREIQGFRSHDLEVKILPCLSFQPGGSSSHESVKWLTFADLTAFPGRLMREFARVPGAFLKMFGFFLARPPRHLEGWVHSMAGFFLAITRAEDCRKSGFDFFHGAWATAPATAAAILSRLCGKPFSFGAHAYDLYRHGGDPFLHLKLHRAAFIHTTTLASMSHLKKMGVGEGKIIMSRRGLPGLPKVSFPKETRQPFRILSIDRLVAKKGHIHQLAACRRLKENGFPFQLRMIGEGPERDRIEKKIHELNLQREIETIGALPPEKLEEHFQWADIFWHTGVVDSAGDRDGLPNSVAEAMAYGLPVIVSRMPGVMEAVIHEQTGLAVEVSDPAALADAVLRLSGDPELRRTLGVNERKWVEENFLVEKNSAILIGAFRGRISGK